MNFDDLAAGLDSAGKHMVGIEGGYQIAQAGLTESAQQLLEISGGLRDTVAALNIATRGVTNRPGIDFSAKCDAAELEYDIVLEGSALHDDMLSGIKAVDGHAVKATERIAFAQDRLASITKRLGLAANELAKVVLPTLKEAHDAYGRTGEAAHGILESEADYRDNHGFRPRGDWPPGSRH